MISRAHVCGIASTKFEAVTVALKVSEIPMVYAVAPGDGVNDGDLRFELPDISIRIRGLTRVVRQVLKTNLPQI